MKKHYSGYIHVCMKKSLKYLAVHRTNIKDSSGETFTCGGFGNNKSQLINLMKNNEISKTPEDSIFEE